MYERKLTKEQTYKAMFVFLEKQYDLGWKELGGLLGSMALLEDGTPVDQAFIQDWKDAILEVLSG